MAVAKPKTLHAAILAARDDMPDLIKDAKNPHFKNTYSSLNNVIDTVTPSLEKFDLWLSHVGEMRDGVSTLVTTLKHESGEFIESVLPIQGNDPQKVGSAITYMRRYAILAMLNLAADDDDGNVASGIKVEPKKPSDAQNKLIKTLLKSVRSATSKADGDAVTVELVGKTLDALNVKDAATLIDKLKEEEGARKGAF